MAITVEPFKPFHIDVLIAQGVQKAQLGAVSNVPQGYATLPKGPSMTVRSGENILVCGGIVDISKQRGICWALIGESARGHMLVLHRAVHRFINLDHWRRLEATVEKGFSSGCRWVEILGFKFEGEMPGYGDNGESHLRYGRVWHS